MGNMDAPTLLCDDCMAVLTALSDAVVDEYLPTGVLTVRVGHGLPDLDFPLNQPALGDWWRARVQPDKLERVTEGVFAVATGAQDSWMDEYVFHWSPVLDVHVVHRVLLRRDAKGTPERIVHVFQDATAQRKAQEQLMAERQELEVRVAERTHALALKNAEIARAMRHKDDFMASMSHELRTPLNAVIGLTDAMLEGIGGPLTDRQRGWLDDIAASGKHLLGLINDILDLARIESGRVDLDVQRVQPAEEAEAARRLVAGAAFARGVHVSLELAPRLPMLTTDPRFLRQILLNLLGNAVKFTEPGGHVVCRIIDDTGHVAFQVSDTGVGIAPERLADIFKPFVQLDQGLDRAVEGTGLGLALVARMTERLGGSVQVDSAPGEGSTFTVRIPSLVAPPRDSAEVVITDAEDPSVSRPLRILLAEDNPANVRTFSEYLGAKGMDVRVVGDGVAAVEAATVVRPDVILMDIQMPRMDGLQATRLIRDNPDIRGIPIVALTALAMPGDRERCLEAGATVYLPKPVRLRELVTTIRTLVAGGAS